MKLTGPQFQQIQEALLDAYTEFGLRQMLRVQMDVDLDRVAGGNNLSELTFSLIQWAERHGQVQRLIEAAYEGNQENPQLAKLAADAKSRFLGQVETREPLEDVSPATPQGPHQVFLSYSRKDTDLMQEVHRALTDAGLTVWTDEGLKVGTSSWQRAIEQAIKDAQCMIVLMSPDSKQSKWVNIEVNYALETGLSVLPVLIRGERQEAVLFSLYDTQYEDAREDVSFACEKLIAALNKSADVAVSPSRTGEPVQVEQEPEGPTIVPPSTVETLDAQDLPSTPGPSPESPPKTPRNWIGIVVALLALVGTLAVAYATFMGGEGTTVLEMTATAEAIPAAAELPIDTPSPTAAPTATATYIPPSILSDVPEEMEAGTVALRGQVEPDAIVEILINGTPIARTEAHGDGSWETSIDLEEDGTYDIEVVADVAGIMISGPSEPLRVSILPSPMPIPTETPTVTPVPPTRTPTLKPLVAVTEATIKLKPKINPVDGAEYVVIPAGDFIMGSDDTYEFASDDEKPQHLVYLDEFWIMRNEVTNAQYSKCLEAGVCEVEPANSHWSDPTYAEHPVTDIDWLAASAYAEWVGGRLPTEAEWEKACRGTDGRIFPWGNEPPTRQLADYSRNMLVTATKFLYRPAKPKTVEVGSRPDGAGYYGLFDMAGNVWEWTADWYDDDYYTRSSEVNPPGSESGEHRTLRGGSWYSTKEDVHCASRFSLFPEFRYDHIVGFRVSSPGF